MSVGEHVRQIREDAGISLRALADHAGVSSTFLSDFETGKRECRPHTLAKIAKGLNTLGVAVTLDELKAIRARTKLERLRTEVKQLERKIS